VVPVYAATKGGNMEVGVDGPVTVRVVVIGVEGGVEERYWRSSRYAFGAGTGCGSGFGSPLFGGGNTSVPVAVGVALPLSVASVVGLRLVVIPVAGEPGWLGVVRGMACGKAATVG
jgi:hypothetical protein